MKKTSGFSGDEKKAIAGLSAVISFRVLGLSLLIPIFVIYAMGLPGASPMLAGLAMGTYGLTQAILQIPFGYMSDKYGRKPVVAGGLILYGLGSVMAALTTNIHMLIAARALQGGGAIASSCFAWVADLTEVSRRNMAMAFLGMSVGLSMVLGLVFGPIIAGAHSVPFVFWVTAALAGVGVLITVFLLKEPPKSKRHSEHDFDISLTALFQYAATPALLRFDFIGFLVSACMVATFFVVPLRLKQHMDIHELWKVYIPLSVLGSLAMMYASRKADKGHQKSVFITALGLLAIAFAILSYGTGFWITFAGFAVFFTGFFILEAALPAAVSKLAEERHKGSIIGVYNFSQFMGSFIGGIFAGWLGARAGAAMFIAMALASLIAMATIATGTSGGGVE